MRFKTITILVIMLSLLTALPAAARKLAPGATLNRYRINGDATYVVRANLSKRSLGTNPTTSHFPMKRKNLVRSGGIMGVNADFLCKRKQPCHLFMRGREIWTTGRGGGGPSLQVSNNHATIAVPGDGTATWYAFIRNGLGETKRIKHINYGHKGLVAFTSRGGTEERPKDGRCYVRLHRRTGWVRADDGWSREYRVKVNRCGKAPAVRSGTMVLQANKRLPWHRGDNVTYVQQVEQPGANNVVGGMTPLVLNGQNVAPGFKGGPGSIDHDGYYYEPAPRTVLAVSKDGRSIFLVVVDGKPSNRAGVRFPELARFLINKLNVGAAFNLDGGGASIMWTKGKGVVSKPSYGYVRPQIFATVIR